MPSNLTTIPAPRVPLISADTGLISTEWYRFLFNLYTLSGSGSNTITLDELQIGPPAQPTTTTGGGGGGTVTSVATGTGLSGGPITTTGTIDFVVAAVGTWAATPSSANLLAAMTDETGTGALVFANTPTLVTPILGTPTSGDFSTGTFTWPTFNQNTTGYAAGLAGGLIGSLPYQSAVNTTVFLAAGTNGQVLTLAAGVPSWATPTTGTVTSVAATAGTGISVTGSPITTSGTLNITNTAPDQTVVLTAGTGISTSGTYPNFTITNTSPSLGGDVVGPVSATDNAVARFDTTTGKLLQNSVVTVGDTGAVTGITTLAASTSVNTPIVQATSSAGLALKNLGGTTQISMGAGGGDNVTIAVATNINGANAQIDISPTGTGHVHIKPTGTGAVEIAPTNAGTMNNMVIGGTTPLAGSFTDLSVTGTTSFDGAQGTAGQVLTSAGTGNTPTWTTPTTGTVTSVGGTGTVNGITLTGTVTSSGNLTLGGTLSGVSLTTQVSGTLPILNGGTGQTTASAAFNALSPITTTGDLILGNGTNSATRLAIGVNTYVLTSNGTTASWQAPAAGGSNITTLGMWENKKIISSNYTIGTGNSAMSAGPITINSGVSVTVPSGSRWVVL
jgi:hypothetical protein